MNIASDDDNGHVSLESLMEMLSSLSLVGKVLVRLRRFRRVMILKSMLMKGSRGRRPLQFGRTLRKYYNLV
jgi:hypothetical protein